MIEHISFVFLFLVKVPVAGYKLRNDLCRGIPRIWDNYYVLDKEKDVGFEIARLYYGLRRHAEALKFYEVSNCSFGEHHVTYHNMVSQFIV